MPFLLQNFRQVWEEVFARFRTRGREGPIDTTAKMNQFVASRAAFVTQKKLYGYLKTRMGTRYVSVFRDETFIESVNIAKMQIFAAALSDLTIFCVSKATVGTSIDVSRRQALARECYVQGVDANASQIPDSASVDRWLADFDERLDGLHWENAGVSGDVFEKSPEALVRWAPIAPELKKYDAKIVRNSIRFAWNEVRIDFRSRVDADALHAEMAGHEIGSL